MRIRGGCNPSCKPASFPSAPIRTFHERMFESMTDRIAGTLLMGLDVAVEFATLGEFRLVEADASPAPDLFQAAPLVRRPARRASIDPDRQLLPPASTAIARAAAESAARVAARRNAARPDGRRSAARPPLQAGGKAVIPSAVRRRSAAPSFGAPPARPRAGTAKPRTRGGAVESGTQLCLFGR